jgi:hypothetical protein
LVRNEHPVLFCGVIIPKGGAWKSASAIGFVRKRRRTCLFPTKWMCPWRDGRSRTGC